MSRMNISIARISEAGIEVSWSTSAEDLEIPFDAELTDVRDIRFRGRIVRQGEDFVVRGVAAATLVLACARCLELTEVPVEARLEALFLPRGAEESGEGAGAEVVIRPEDDLVMMHDGHTLDIGEVLRDSLLVQVPYKPLCRADCRGLCPTCGVNLNEEVCGCKQQTVDPRLRVLEKLKQSLPAGAAESGSSS
jgi:uncharacterized protein